MDRPLSISNFKQINKVLSTEAYRSTAISVLMIPGLFIMCEVLIRLVFTPCFVPVEVYKRFNPIHITYGFATDLPLFHTCGEETFYIGVDQSTSRRYPSTKTKSDRRIFIIGSSVSIRPENDNYALKLEQTLNQGSDSANPYQVINASTKGYGTTRLHVVLEQILAHHQQPDLIIIHPHGSNEFEDEVQQAYLEDIQAKWYNKLLYRSQFFLVLKSFNQWLSPEFFHESTGDAERAAEQDTARIAKWQASIKHNLTAMCQLANQAQVPVILIQRIVNPQLSDQSDFTDSLTRDINNNTLQSVQSCDMIYVLDTPALLQETYLLPEQVAPETLFFDRSHLRPKIHELIAEQLSDMILNEIVISAIN